MKYLLPIVIFFSSSVQSYNLDIYLQENDKLVKAKLGELTKFSVGSKVAPIILTDVINTPLRS